MYWGFAWGLREFLKKPINLEQCRGIVQNGLKNREQNLLDTTKKTVFDNRNNPYLELLKLVGCEYSDFKNMVCSYGIESTLHRLRDAGVYISCEEFKGQKEVVRSGKVFRFRESDFDNPFLVQHFEGSTGGSRSSGTRVIINLGRYYRSAASIGVTFDAHGIWGSPVILWYPILPSVAWLVTMLCLAKIGKTPIRWLSQVKTEEVKPSLAKRLATYYAVYAGRLFGAAIPKPEYIDLEHSYKVAGYISETLRKGQGCIVMTYTNSAVRACQAAGERKLDIFGATFIVGGEPLTEAKLKEIRAVGANAINWYVGADVGLVGYGCVNPMEVGDIHHFMDSKAIIQHKRQAPFGNVDVSAFLFTSLLPTAAKIMLNVENGDYGVIEKRDCGCKLGELGFTNHIYNIRGFDKLTGEGMTFIGTDLLRVIEEVLPARFGGASIDYQMVEEEDERGHTRMSVLVSPEVGVIDEDELIKIVISELSKGKDYQRVMAEIWSQAKTLRVKRIRPYITAAGKLLPLHIHKGRSDNSE
jgi:hypothetical protein